MGDAVNAAATDCNIRDIHLHDLPFGVEPCQPISCILIPVNAEGRHDDGAIRDEVVDIRAGEDVAAVVRLKRFLNYLDFEFMARSISGAADGVEIFLLIVVARRSPGGHGVDACSSQD